MYTLYIDTHSNKIDICLFKDGNLLKHVNSESVQQHSVIVLPTIRALLEDFSITVKDLGEIIVINGPGSFTGVRIGVTIAKTLSYCLNIPIKLLDSLFIKAVSIEGNEKYISLVDKHGAFVGVFDKDNNKLSEYKYISKTEYENECNIHSYVSDVKLDFNKIYESSKNISAVPSHAANPLYIKDIEALNGKKN